MITDQLWKLSGQQLKNKGILKNSRKWKLSGNRIVNTENDKVLGFKRDPENKSYKIFESSILLDKKGNPYHPGQEWTKVFIGGDGWFILKNELCTSGNKVLSAATADKFSISDAFPWQENFSGTKNKSNISIS